MSGLNARLFPASLAFADALYSAPAGLRAVMLQGASPLVRESLIAAWPIAGMIEKNVP